MEAPDQQQMTPQISENAAIEQVDLHFVGLVDTEEETVGAEVFRELGESLDVHALGKHDIAEIFSPPRFTKRANSFGLKPGYAIDLETCRGNGERWDLTNKTHQKDLEAILNDEDPYLLTGSPPCEAFSLLQGLNKNKVPEEVRQQRLKEGRDKLKISIKYYNDRRKKGRYFLHEHPAHATSWREPEMVDLTNQKGRLRGRRTHVQMGDEEQGREWDWICEKADEVGNQFLGSVPLPCLALPYGLQHCRYPFLLPPSPYSNTALALLLPCLWHRFAPGLLSHQLSVRPLPKRLHAVYGCSLYLLAPKAVDSSE